MPFYPPEADWQLAEVNIAKLRAPMDDPIVQPFFQVIDRINSIAERMDGFIWRHNDDGTAVNTSEILNDPRVVYNASTWADVASLETFVWGTVHKRFYERREEWFNSLESMHFAMWWVPPNATFTPDEAMLRLERLDQEGPTEFAFGWKDVPGAKLWATSQCSQETA